MATYETPLRIMGHVRASSCTIHFQASMNDKLRQLAGIIVLPTAKMQK
jgi:hypothetical protein